MVGRPSDYSPETAALICERIAQGESLRTICQDEGFPAQSTVFLWLKKHADFSEQYARAREAQMEAMAEEILEIADETANDTIETENGARPDHEWISRSKLRVDTRKWLMSKLAPKKYGDKVTSELTGANGGPIETKDVSDLEVARRIAFALAKGEQALKKDND